MENEDLQGENLDEKNQEFEELEGTEDIEAIKKEVETLKAQKAHWKKKFEESQAKPQAKDETGETETPKKQESNEPDYAKEAFLEQRGVVHADDKKIIYDEATRLKLPLTDVLSMDHIKAKLKDSKEQREAEDGMPGGKGKPGASNKSSEDYWLNKKNKDGSYATPEDHDLAIKVINKRIQSEEKSNMFDPIR